MTKNKKIQIEHLSVSFEKWYLIILLSVRSFSLSLQIRMQRISFTMDFICIWLVCSWSILCVILVLLTLAKHTVCHWCKNCGVLHEMRLRYGVSEHICYMSLFNTNNLQFNTYSYSHPLEWFKMMTSYFANAFSCICLIHINGCLSNSSPTIVIHTTYSIQYSWNLINFTALFLMLKQFTDQTYYYLCLHVRVWKCVCMNSLPMSHLHYLKTRVWQKGGSEIK